MTCQHKLNDKISEVAECKYCKKWTTWLECGECMAWVCLLCNKTFDEIEKGMK